MKGNTISASLTSLHFCILQSIEGLLLMRHCKCTSFDDDHQRVIAWHMPRAEWCDALTLYCVQNLGNLTPMEVSSMFGQPCSRHGPWKQGGSQHLLEERERLLPLRDRERLLRDRDLLLPLRERERERSPRGLGDRPPSSALTTSASFSNSCTAHWTVMPMRKRAARVQHMGGSWGYCSAAGCIDRGQAAGLAGWSGTPG